MKFLSFAWDRIVPANLFFRRNLFLRFRNDYATAGFYRHFSYP